jgi:predicted O-methyltransferase YrrM
MVMRSSYKQHGLGLKLTEIVLEHEPTFIVEFGVLDGYSTIHLALGLQLLEQSYGMVTAYDLWNKYEYTHGDFQQVQSRITKLRLDHIVNLKQGEFWNWLAKPEVFHLLHIDISNDGNIIETAVTTLLPAIEKGSVIIFEGGSEERDNIEWMKKHNRRPIQSIRDKIPYKIIVPEFPSISMVDQECVQKLT